MFLVVILPAVVIGMELLACDYTKPISAIQIQGSGLPCSDIYTSSLNTDAIIPNTPLKIIHDTNALSAVEGRRCYKLKLHTSCRQRWFSSNEILRYTETIDVNRADCMSSSTCMNCQISEKYLPEQCKTFDFGWNIVTNTITFGFPETVFADKIGGYTFSGNRSTENFFKLGGSYKEMLFFDHIDFDIYINNTSGYYDSTTHMLVIPRLRKLIFYSGFNVTYNGETWMIYDTNNYVSIKKTRILSANQNYFDFYMASLINITDWKIKYLECRVKNLMLVNRYDPDVSAGERYDNNTITKYECKRIRGGVVSSKDGCMTYQIGEDTYYISTNSEVTPNNKSCIRQLRLNSSHVLNLNSDGGLDYVAYQYPSLQDEESILNFPPKIEDDAQKIRSLITSYRYSPTNDPGNGLKTSISISEKDKGTTAGEIGGWLAYLIIIWLALVTWKLLSKGASITIEPPTTERELRNIMIPIK